MFFCFIKYYVILYLYFIFNLTEKFIINMIDNILIEGSESMVLATSKIYDDYQIDIPEEIIKRCKINKDYIIEWDLTEDDKPVINFRKKKDIND